MSEQIVCPIRIGAATFPEAPAVCDGAVTLTYEQLNVLVGQAQVLLLTKGVTVGDSVAVLAPNSIGGIILFWAAFRLGCVLVPLNVRHTPEDWRRCLEAVEYRLLVYDVEYTPFAAPLTDSLPIDAIPNVASGKQSVLPPQRHSLGRPALIVFTSGSSGAPRGVKLSWKNLYYSARGTVATLLLRPGHGWLAVLPMYHVGGLMIPMRTALAGAAVCLDRVFDTDGIIEAVAFGRITHLSLVPTMLRQLLAHPKADTLKKAAAIICGGEAFDATLRNEVAERNMPVLTTYGMTETTSMVTLLSPDGAPAGLDSYGKILPYRQISISDDGHIRVRGEVLFGGYLDGDDAAVSVDGWFDTGDIGHLDEDGFLYVTGRADSMIVSGGENIHLDTIEVALTAVPEIRLAAVLSRPDNRWGCRPVAFVEIETAAVDEDELRRHLGTVLPRIMIPDRIIIIETMPTTAIGKPDRRRLRELYSKYLA